jgi:hypothetical protein
MSYLASVVHPLIVIRLLEHRLFTPLLKKTNPNHNPINSIKTNNSFSLFTSTNNQAPAANHAPTTTPISESKKISPSTSFTSNSHLLTIETTKSNSSSSPLGGSGRHSTTVRYGKCNENLNDEEFLDLKPNNQISLLSKNKYESKGTDSLDINDNFIITEVGGAGLNINHNNYNKINVSPMHASSNGSQTSSSVTSSKKTLFKDLSQRLLKTVNVSSNNKLNLNLKLNKNRKNSSTTPNEVHEKDSSKFLLYNRKKYDKSEFYLIRLYLKRMILKPLRVKL